tara:strand:- start:1327 stop:2166 length:840 start_codon:yes stop_codon:yes gene_type:complete
MADKNEYENGFIYGFDIDEKMCDDLVDWFEEINEGEHTYGTSPTDTVAKYRGITVGQPWAKENVLEKLKSLHKQGKITEAEFRKRAGKRSMDLSFGAFHSHPAIRNYLDKGLASVLKKYKEKFPHAFDEGNIGFVPPGCMPDSNLRLKTGYGTFPWKVGTTMNIQKYEPGEGFFSWHCERTIPMRETVDRALVFMTYLNDVPNGGTKFFHQNIVTPARKGLTLVWPVDWTHVHTGQISETSEKYIITGWVHYIRTGVGNSNEMPYFYTLPPRTSKRTDI